MPTKTTVVAAFVVVFAFMLGAVCANEQAEKVRASYKNIDFGFAMSPPEFGVPKPPVNVLAATFSAPTRNGFSANLNVVIQPVKSTRAAIAKETFRKLETMGMQINSKNDLQVSGHDAFVVDYEGKIRDNDVRCLCLVVIDAERLVLVTGTALRADFAVSEAEFKRSIESFKLE